MEISSALKAGIEHGFLDSSVIAEGNYKPTLLVNDVDRGEKVLTSIIHELETCDEFLFSVAFITEGGVVALLQTLSELRDKNIKGKIVASQYLNFTQPKALKRLMEFPNIELRILCEDNMHAKGYIFRHGNEYTSIVGSSNLTQTALCENREWNVKLISSAEGKLTKDTLAEFNRIFDIAKVVDDEYLEEYRKIYAKNTFLEKASKKEMEAFEVTNFIGRVNPNKMQTAALKSLENLRDEGKDKALLISATGTGKTYLAAFDVRKFVEPIENPRVLFIIHREQIAKDAMNSFWKVTGDQYTMGLLTGSKKYGDADFVFSTIQTLSKDEVLSSFDKDTFDYIVIDEVHRAGATSYQKVLEYFTPKFTLGMTATPERSDDFDIFELFDHNIAYEIRLQDAMKEKMICPFHYFGITELTENGKVFSDKTEFSNLISDDRVDHIIREAEFFGYSGDRVKGLVFCSRKDEAKELSDKFNQRGYKALALSGEDSQAKREEAVECLEKGGEDGLDYIFTVDIFNEGVDIPAVNQIIMLRPTESAIVFVQQLGRGLRLYEDKEFVVVLDFIGSYTKNFLIPLALSGDRTYNKDNVRRYVDSGNQIIPGCSTIHFDPITKERIFESIDSANFNDVRLIKNSFKNLKYKLGRRPTLRDFDRYGEIDPIRMFQSKSYGSYHAFLRSYEKKNYTVSFSKEQEEILKFVSMKFAEGKRPHELLIFKNLIKDPNGNPFRNFNESLEETYKIHATEHTQESVIRNLTNEFQAGTDKEKFSNCVFLTKTDEEYVIAPNFKELLKDTEFFNQLEEVVEFGLYRCLRDYFEPYKNTALNLYRKYTYEDACRLLEWDKNLTSVIGGYKYYEKTNSFPVFINYNKEENISDSTKYEDRFVTPTTLIAISKSGRNLESKDVTQMLNSDKLNIAMDLFVRKNKDDKISKEFYYLGRIHPTGEANEFKMDNTNKTAVELEYYLENPVRDDVYRYLTE